MHSVRVGLILADSANMVMRIGYSWLFMKSKAPALHFYSWVPSLKSCSVSAVAAASLGESQVLLLLLNVSGSGSLLLVISMLLQAAHSCAQHGNVQVLLACNARLYLHQIRFLISMHLHSSTYLKALTAGPALQAMSTHCWESVSIAHLMLSLAPRRRQQKA